MSDFSCEVVRVKIEAHPNADAIEIARVGGYQSIVRKGQFIDGDLAVYIPEQAVVPVWLLKEMGMWDEANNKGVLSGSEGSRVKAIKLRGVLSQGLVFGGVQLSENQEAQTVDQVSLFNPTIDNIGDTREFVEGADAAEFLGIVKYEPPLPSHMKGRAIDVNYDATHHYDFENLKKRTTLFEDGEEVVITEKIHGTLLQVGVVPTNKADKKFYMGRVVISSKGLGSKGIILDHNDEANMYAQAAKKWGLLDSVLNELGPIADELECPVFALGEVFGRTLSGAIVQDLTYDDQPLNYRLFDVCKGNRGAETYVPFNELRKLANRLSVSLVPVLYAGPYSADVVAAFTDGFSTIPGAEKQIREGCVIKSLHEATNKHFGRKIAKSVSEAYLMRKTKNATEYN